jgi:2-polyprenyl-3-methyl-5-hydroxy-6-metoxy-1,4-benzoquinol methylase
MDFELRNSWRRQYISPAALCLYAAVLPCLRAHASGRLLDIGCGNMPFREYLSALVAEYHSLDIAQKLPEVDFVSDIQDMRSLAQASYDTVLCSEVLEHIPQPNKAISEVYRILRPGGKFILSVPYLGRLHEEPFDYFRYTKYGLQFLLENHGFRVLEIVATGSLFSFLGHQISTVVVCSVWHVPILNYCAFWLNASLCTFPCYWLDRFFAIAHKLPLGYVAVAESQS